MDRSPRDELVAAIRHALSGREDEEARLERWGAALRLAGRDINAADADGFTGAHELARRAVDIRMFIVAKRAGFDFGAASNRGELPIHAAAASESTESSPSEVIRWLVLDAGQNPDARTGYGLTALHVACLHRDPERVQALIDLGADPNAVSPRGWTPLHAACSASVPEVATALVRAGADRGRVTDRGVTPRDLAALRNERIRASQRTMRMLAPA